MSADWPLQATSSWKATLPCTRGEAEAAMLLDAPLGDDNADGTVPVLMVTEPDAAMPEQWRIDVYSEGPPPAALLARMQALAPSAAGSAPAVEQLADEDWVEKSQAWLQPIRAGRFFVHTAAHAHLVPADAVPFRIEASRAFGTGHHETTAGCLALLDRLAADGHRFEAVADIGTGTGLLALAARALWPVAGILATDIDPVAIEVAAGNLAANGVATTEIALAVADGVDAPAILARQPFDLLIANILAGPLVAMAASFAAVVRPGGTILLAGLLAGQEEEVAAAYREQGFRPADRLASGDWPILRMIR